MLRSLPSSTCQAKRSSSSAVSSPRVRAAASSALPDVLHVLVQHRVVDVVRVAVQLAGDALAQLALGGGGHFAGVAQRGQLGVGRASQQRQPPGPRRAAAGTRRERTRRDCFKTNPGAGKPTTSAVVPIEQSTVQTRLAADQGQVCRAPAVCPACLEQRGIDLAALCREARFQLRSPAWPPAAPAAPGLGIGLPQVGTRPQLHARQRSHGGVRSFPAASRNGRTASSVGPTQRHGLRCRPARCSSSCSSMSMACTTRKRSISNTRCTGRATGHRPQAVAPAPPAASAPPPPGRAAVPRAAWRRLNTAKRDQRAEDDVDRHDQQEQVAAAGDLAVGVGIPERRTPAARRAPRLAMLRPRWMPAARSRSRQSIVAV